MLRLRAQGTKLEAEVHWDNSTENPKNPSNPPIRVQWGEESRDEMGAIGLQGVAHDETELKALQTAVRQHTNGIVQQRMMSEPGFIKRLQTMFGADLPLAPQQ